MDFAFTEEQNELRELARKILEDRATHPRLREIESSGERINVLLEGVVDGDPLIGSVVEHAVSFDLKRPI